MDLNLLTVLDALLDEGTVHGAADRLHLSQPAVSRALARIRAATGDPILVRTGRSMISTPYARQIQAHVHRIALEAAGLLTPPQSFDPAAARRTFTIRIHDAMACSLAPILIARLRAAAPQATVQLLPESPLELDGARDGWTDLVLNTEQHTAEHVRTKLIGHTALSLVVRADHPLLDGALDLDRLRALEYVVITRWDRMQDEVAYAFQRAGLDQRIVGTLPTSAAIVEVLAASDYAAIMPVDTCWHGIAALEIVARPLPLAVPDLPIVMRWHERFEHDAAHAWLRAIVTDCWAAYTRTSAASTAFGADEPIYSVEAASAHHRELRSLRDRSVRHLHPASAASGSRDVGAGHQRRMEQGQ